MYIVSIADKTFNNKPASENSLIEGDNTSSEVTQPLQKKNGMYQISGYILILNSVAHLIGNATNNADLTRAGYTLPIQAKPYLSKDQF